MATVDTPEAITEIRRRITHHIDRYERFAQAAGERGDHDAAGRWRHAARCLRRDLLGNGTCVIAAFDERRPELAALYDTLTKETM
jgi:hypothetical protein